ncbi:MAG TPA: hypothetical protein VH796_17020 [Nitrososphaeraceae archaeon]|jgi:hypothetical protein
MIDLIAHQFSTQCGIFNIIFRNYSLQPVAIGEALGLEMAAQKAVKELSSLLKDKQLPKQLISINKY